jgi:hypothetical protein
MAKKQSAASKKGKAAGAKGKAKVHKAGLAALATAANGGAAPPAALVGNAHVSKGYTLKMANSNEACRFDLEVSGDDGGQCFLRVSDPGDRPALVKKALATLGKFWPDYSWPFKADPNGNIIDIG